MEYPNIRNSVKLQKRRDIIILSILFEALSPLLREYNLKNHTRALGEDFTVEPYDAGNTGTND